MTPSQPSNHHNQAAEVCVVVFGELALLYFIIMAGGNKKKKQQRGKSRKNGTTNRSNSNKSAPTLENVLTQAESAMEMSDIDTAMKLFAYAAETLRSRIHSGGDGSASGGFGPPTPPPDVF